MKRKLSEAEEDFLDYDEEDQCSVSRSEDAGEGGSTRKRRRGLIEKKRRDRINDSLCELKRLVPTAMEKSSSTKLEKAEILQMTVDHLKAVQGRGDYPDSRTMMEYQSIGFRECMGEVSRYLVTIEGLDIQDPLRLRLMSHLHSYAARGGGSGGSWQYSTHHYASQEKPALLDAQSFLGAEATSYSRSGGSHATPAYTNPGYTNYSTFSSLHIPPPGTPYHPPPNGKPYRPWGAEMAY